MNAPMFPITTSETPASEPPISGIPDTDSRTPDTSGTCRFSLLRAVVFVVLFIMPLEW